MTDPKELVRHGYDAVSYQYRGDHDDDPGERREWIERVIARLDQGAHVLDLGCGCGVPVSRALVDAGMRVTGVDLSDVQVERARAAGFTVEAEEFVPEGSGGHSLFWCRVGRSGGAT